MKISMDIDGVLADFWNPYIKRFGAPKKDSDISKNCMRKLRTDKKFWLSLPVLNTLPFTPTQYTTARIIPKCWIKEYLNKSGQPKAPVYQVLGYSLSKLPKLKMGGCDVHIDDSLSVFFDLNLNGFPCLLYPSSANEEWGKIGRISSLNEEEIQKQYNQLKTINFKEVYDDFMQSRYYKTNSDS